MLNDFYVENRSDEYDEDEYVEKSAFESVYEPNKTTLSAYIKYYLDGNYGILENKQDCVC